MSTSGQADPRLTRGPRVPGELCWAWGALGIGGVACSGLRWTVCVLLHLSTGLLRPPLLPLFQVGWEGGQEGEGWPSLLTPRPPSLAAPTPSAPGLLPEPRRPHLCPDAQAPVAGQQLRLETQGLP